MGSLLRRPCSDLAKFQTHPSSSSRPCYLQEWRMIELECSQYFYHYDAMGAICCHGNQSSNLIWPTILCKLSPAQKMFQIQLDAIFMFERGEQTRRQTLAWVPSYKLTRSLWLRWAKNVALVSYVLALLRWSSEGYIWLTILSKQILFILRILDKYYIPCAGDSRKYHPEECDYQPRRSRGW